MTALCLCNAKGYFCVSYVFVYVKFDKQMKYANLSFLCPCAIVYIVHFFS